MTTHELVPPAPRHSVEDVDSCLDVTTGDSYEELKQLAIIEKQCGVLGPIALMNTGEADA